jgi:hypothetical protein
MPYAASFSRVLESLISPMFEYVLDVQSPFHICRRNVRCLKFVIEGTMSGEQLRESVAVAFPRQGNREEAMH